MNATKWSLLIGLLGCAVGAVAAPPALLIRVEKAPLAWADASLDDRLMTRLTLKAAQPVELIADLDSSFPGNRAPLEELAAWGRERQTQSLLLITITGERLERRKSFQVPLIFHKWETIGVLEGQFRLIDVLRGRVLAAEPFCIELHGPRAIQGTMDDNIDDPDIHLRAPEKELFFAQLENKLVDQLAERVQPLTSRHDREAYAQKTKGK